MIAKTTFFIVHQNNSLFCEMLHCRGNWLLTPPPPRFISFCLTFFVVDWNRFRPWPTNRSNCVEEGKIDIHGCTGTLSLFFFSVEWNWKVVKVFLMNIKIHQSVWCRTVIWRIARLVQELSPNRVAGVARAGMDASMRDALAEVEKDRSQLSGVIVSRFPSRYFFLVIIHHTTHIHPLILQK